MKKYQGFTLAEVLITLAIIGVVAAMTVPALMTSTRGKEYEVGAQKAISTLANAITMRGAMEGQALQNFSGTLGQFLVIPPGCIQGAMRMGEQAALPTTYMATAENTPYAGTISQAGCTAAAGPGMGSTVTSVTLKDGMIVGGLTAAAGAPATNGNCGNPTAGQGCTITIDTNGVKGPTRTIPGGTPVATGGTTTNPTPDVITVMIRDTVVEPADQRTRNILATGSAMLSQ